MLLNAAGSSDSQISKRRQNDKKDNKDDQSKEQLPYKERLSREDFEWTKTTRGKIRKI